MDRFARYPSSTMKKKAENVDIKKLAEIPDFMSKLDYKLSLESSYNIKKAQPIYIYLNNPWTKLEKASLILGSHIFEKDFVQVKRFIGTKTMDELQTFYYTKFYNSEDHKRWRIYREAREIRRGVYVQKLFTEPTHQHLLSRLLHNESVEYCCSKLLEVTKNFWRGNLKLEEYVFALKDLVGLEALIDAVGIGKENDLTSLTADSMKSIYEILEGKDYSNLTHIEIILLLTCDIQVSKTRASDLFWEAVWPRLLAKGWSSKNYTFSFKSPLIFIVPGIENFSRKQVKGIHYFDSIKDLLAKVASHPELIKYPAKESTIDLNLQVDLKKVECDETAVNEDPNFVRVSTSQDYFKNQDVRTVRRSIRSTKPSLKAVEAIVYKYEEEETSNKRMRR